MCVNLKKKSSTLGFLKRGRKIEWDSIKMNIQAQLYFCMPAVNYVDTGLLKCNAIYNCSKNEILGINLTRSVPDLYADTYKTLT